MLHARPQEIAREFKLNKNLAWKIAKLVHQAPSHESLAFLPGPSGFRIALEALEAQQASPADLKAARLAYKGFQEMVDRHASDRPAMQLLLDSLAVQEGDVSRLDESRQLVYQGNSGILGIQADVRLASFFLAPNPEQPSLLDSATLGGLFGLRRFRPNASWVLSRNAGFDDDGTEVPTPERQALDPSFSGSGPSLLGDFCSKPLPEVTVRKLGKREIYELAHGPIGNTGEGDVSFGHYCRADLPRYRDANNQNGEFHVFFSSPVKTLLIDLFLHKDLDLQQPPEALMPLNFNQDLMHLQSRKEQDFLPLPEQPQLLHGERPSVVTPLVKRYPEMTDLVYKRLGWKAEDFRAWRMELSFPPLPATLILSFPLADQPR
ncbi:MAG: hypothetical protein HOD03_05905 [Planctomycetes bacterium]|jgi:hypothetical protein|nr:hypothetical protein [Planctomycetota bacterium]